MVYTGLNRELHQRPGASGNQTSIDIYRIPDSVSAIKKDGYLHLPALILTLWGEQRQQQADWIN
jgi:hypothetical protein